MFSYYGTTVLWWQQAKVIWLPRCFPIFPAPLFSAPRGVTILCKEEEEGRGVSSGPLGLKLQQESKLSVCTKKTKRRRGGRKALLGCFQKTPPPIDTASHKKTFYTLTCIKSCLKLACFENIKAQYLPIHAHGMFLKFFYSLYVLLRS